MKTIITIGRQYGSAGHSIGKILADDLGIKYYDKELLERAAKDSGLCQELFENHDEKPTNSFLYSLVMDSYSFGYGSTMMDMPLNQKVFLAQFDAIKKISQDGPCVIVGRCADYALEENPNVLSIFIKADMQDRIRRIAKLYDLSDAKAKDKITKIDKQRASYYNYYTSKRWGEVDSYDLCLNSSVFGIDGTVDMIKQAIEVKEAGIRKIFSICSKQNIGETTLLLKIRGGSFYERILKMRIVIQRVKRASVSVEEKVVGSIQKGFLVLIGVGQGDDEATADKYMKKLLGLRIFEDENGKTNKSLADVDGQLLMVSQFTLYANCKKGNRPSFTEAGEPHRAEELYEYMVAKAREQVPVVETGVFGAEMEVSLVNDGPFTVILEDL